MRQRGFAPIIILTLVLLGIAGYFAYKYYISPKGTILGPYLPSPVATSIPNEATPTVKPSTDPTANWKTYKSILYSYSVEYPPDWNVVETKHNVASVIEPSKQKIMTELSNSKSSIKVFYEGDWDHGFEPWVFKISSKVDIGGKEATMSTLTLAGNPNEWTIYTIGNFHDFRIETLTPSSDRNIISQIISTFKFTENQNTASITQRELDLGWYWGFVDQKKSGTPDSWLFKDAGRSSCWHKLGVNCTL